MNILSFKRLTLRDNFPFSWNLHFALLNRGMILLFCKWLLLSRELFSLFLDYSDCFSLISCLLLFSFSFSFSFFFFIFSFSFFSSFFFFLYEAHSVFNESKYFSSIPYWLGDIWCCVYKVSTFLFHTLPVCKSLHAWLGCNININPVACGHCVNIREKDKRKSLSKWGTYTKF